MTITIATTISSNVSFFRRTKYHDNNDRYKTSNLPPQDRDLALGLLTRMQGDLSRKDRAISCLARKLEVVARESEKRREEMDELSTAFARARDVRRVLEEREAAEKEIKTLKGKVKSVEELVSGEIDRQGE